MLQSLYRLFLVATCLVSAGSYVAVVIFLASSVLPTGFSVTLLVIAIVLVSTVVSLTLRWRGQNRLCIPASEAAYKRVMIAVTTIAVMWMVVGGARWPSAPLRPSGGGYVDKRGAMYDAKSYHSFRKWEVTCPLAWLPFAMLAIAVFPAATPGSRRIRTC